MNYRELLSLYGITEQDLRDFKSLEGIFSEEFKNKLSEETKLFVLKYLPKGAQILMKGDLENAFKGTIEKFLETFFKSPSVLESYVETVAKTHVSIKVPPQEFFLDFLKFYEVLFLDQEFPKGKEKLFKKFLLTVLLTGVYILLQVLEDVEVKELRDPVTGLLPSRDLVIQAPELLRKYKTVAVIDIDRFWEVNFYHGYVTGNALLALFASTLRNRFPGSTIFRWQNDEFVIFTNEEAEEVREKLSKLRKEFSGSTLFLPTRKGSAEVKISFSGIVSPTELFAEKDLKVIHWELYRLLDEVKNSEEVTFKLIREKDLEKLEKEKKLIDGVIDALYHRRVRLAFQRVVNIHTGETVYSEILARLEIDGKIVSAGAFIDLIEGTTVEAELDKLVLEKVFSPISVASKLGKLSVNLSFPFLRNQYPWLSKKLKITDRRGNFIFELTEREDVFKIQEIVNKLKGLSTLGAEISLDDFGVKFSNFLLIKKLPVNHVKIDGSIVKDSMKSELDRAFLESIIKLAKLKNIDVTAEYVDSEEIAEALKELGERYGFKNIYGQGYLWHKPEILE